MAYQVWEDVGGDGEYSYNGKTSQKISLNTKTKIWSTWVQSPDCDLAEEVARPCFNIFEPDRLGDNRLFVITKVVLDGKVTL